MSTKALEGNNNTVLCYGQPAAVTVPEEQIPGTQLDAVLVGLVKDLAFDKSSRVQRS